MRIKMGKDFSLALHQYYIEVISTTRFNTTIKIKKYRNIYSRISTLKRRLLPVELSAQDLNLK
jgi:hypothetical protein